MYWIIMFDSEFHGGGVAFVSTSKTEEEAEKLVLENVQYNWETVKAKVIGQTNQIDLSELDFKKEVYYYGGDCC